MRISLLTLYYKEKLLFVSLHLVPVMRFLGIPCRVITNYQSAHDVDANLAIDVYHADYGVREKPSRDSVW